MSMATAAPDQSLCPQARDPKPPGGCRSCHGCHCHRPQFPSQQELQSPTSQDCFFFFFYFFHAVSRKQQLCGEGHQLYSWSQGHRWRAVQLQGPPHGCDGSPLAVLSASCLTLSILHKHSSADGPLLLKNLQRLSETNWMKSEVSRGIQGPRHSGSVNHLRSDSNKPGNPFFPKHVPCCQASGPLHMTFPLFGVLYPPPSRLRKFAFSLGSL